MSSLIPLDVDIPKQHDSNLENSQISINSIDSNKTISSLPFSPRQIFEVLPEENENSEGVINLSLKIGKKGKVIDHKILQNTTNSQKCLKSVMDAVYKSKWQPVIIEGDKFEYWIEKSYQFND